VPNLAPAGARCATRERAHLVVRALGAGEGFTLPGNRPSASIRVQLFACPSVVYGQGAAHAVPPGDGVHDPEKHCPAAAAHIGYAGSVQFASLEQLTSAAFTATQARAHL